MKKKMPRRRAPVLPAPCRHACLLAGLLIAAPSLADTTPTGYAPTQSDWGGAGLWQTPTARMADPGEVAFTASHASPYTRYNFTLQPLPWLEGILRYSDIGNRPYGPESLSGNQSLKDKSIDAKVRIWRESHWLPSVAVGIRDLGGTGLFAGEYVVASKRFGPVDASLGLAWGYMGSRGDIANPFGFISDKFKVRPNSHASTGGEFNSHNYFRGRAAFFGGISYQTPWDPLVIKLEYEGNDYKHEPQNNNQHQRTPLNIGAVFRLNRAVDFSAALERGNTAMFSITLHTNLAEHAAPAKVLDPPPPPPAPVAAHRAPEQVDWDKVSRELHDNAGLRVSKIARRGRELVVTGEQTKYFYGAKATGRTARVLDNYLDPSIGWYTVESTREGLSIVDTSVHRERFDALADHRITLDQFRLSVEQDEPLPQHEQVLYQPPLKRFDGGASITYGQSLGGPDAFILYQIAANYEANFRFTPNLWWSGVVSANLINNYDKFKYDAPSNLPRVRTYIREYLTSSRVTLPVFQLTGTKRLGEDWYGMAYAGLLESMYGGAGGEVLYRPFGERWAIGADVNWVKQRGFDQDFSFRRYHVVTGHVTAYVDTGLDDVTLAVSAGRYLAGDWGATINVSREFRNGVRMGAYATFTNVSAKRFGEGSFDKGVYISIPFDLMLPRSTVNRANILWQPLIRDGGAALSRRYSLYTLTSDRDSDNFNDNLQMITE
ncbi:YjbH domain-containing protein [Fulvimonas sp. R45]|uniref:YjbH domain-containing protein n=1 Tax=Fulvimonas sp. R45 TaxID=3045937 RepID=UPI00265F969A|nr:YjbH domain-containing protein [Fulvimonas sp. R45]MDO1528131.1 YjbH domain-containing protein [Fulvimonas sp. R45]